MVSPESRRGIFCSVAVVSRLVGTCSDLRRIACVQFSNLFIGLDR